MARPYGGNPLATSIGNAVLDVVLAPGFLEHVGWLGLRLKQGLAGLQERHGGIIAGIRGEGLMQGIALHVPVNDFAAAARAEKESLSFRPPKMSRGCCRR